MARKRSSKKTASAPISYGVSPDDPRSYMERWRQMKATVSETEKWARIELNLGRWAQVAGILGAIVLGLVVLLVIWVPPYSPILENFRRSHMAVWFPLNATSITLAAFTVLRKFGPFRQGLASAHFLSSIGALVVSIAVMVVSLLDQVSVIDLGGLILWMYPASLLGLTLTLTSLAITWEGFGLRKDASIIAAAAAPIVLAIIPLTNSDPDIVLSPALSLLFVYAAIFLMSSGAMIHLTASATEVSQREILRSSDQKIAQLRQETVDKLQALDYREKAYSTLDADLAARKKELLDYEAEVEARAKEVTALETKMDQQRAQMKDGEAKVAMTRAEMDAKVEEFSLKEKELKTAREQVDAARHALEERETALGELDKELKRTQIDMASAERSAQSRAGELANLEARLRKEGADVDTRRNDAIQREKEIQLKESEIKLKLGELEAGQTKEGQERMAQLRDWESRLIAKERELGEYDVRHRQIVGDMERRAAEVESYATTLEKEKQRIALREQELNAHEKLLSDSDAMLEKKGTEVERQWKEVMEMQKRVQTQEAEYNALFKDTKLREAAFSGSEGEMARKLAAIDARDAQLAKWKKELETETREFNQRLREFTAHEKTIERREGQVSLRELEVEKRERDALRPRATPGLAEADPAKIFELREKRLKEKEEEFQRRTYQKEKEFEAREVGMREQIRRLGSATQGDDEPTPEGATHRKDRFKTGIPRLDDMLYGGFPMNANILFVGPAFVGKEVAIMNFIAEGLRTNVPAIIVTTSKPPMEIAKDIAPVLPTFMEYEQLGLIRWIDASGTTPTKKLSRQGNTFRVPHAADFEGILESTSRAEGEFREEAAPYFRVAFLSLSSSFSQSDERVALNFVQRYVNRLRQGKCVAAFALERGMHTDQQIESLQQLMDGALHFKQDKQKTVLSVVGIGDVQTRDWVPYKFTNSSVMMGSFQLERIR